MLGFEDTGKLLTLISGGEKKNLEDIISDFNSDFPLTVKFYAISALGFLVSEPKDKLLPPVQRLMAFAIIHQANASEHASSNPFISMLVDAACDEEAEKYERAFILGLLGFSIPPINCAELLKQSAEDYVRVMSKEFDGLSHLFPPREDLLEKYVKTSSKPFKSVFKDVSVKNVIPDPDVPNGCNSSSKEFDPQPGVTPKIGSGDRAETVRGLMQTLSLEGLGPQWIRPFPPRLPVMHDELLWLNRDMNHELLWDYGMCADTIRRQAPVHEKQEVMMEFADDPKLVEGVAKTKQEKVEDLITENAKNPATTIENPETQVGELRLVAAESVEKAELNDLPSESDDEDDECEDQNDGVSTTDGINKSQEEITDQAQNEALPATCIESDLELDSTNNEEIPGEKDELNNLSSDKKNADNATDERENQINNQNETFSDNLGSTDVVVDAVEFQLQEVSTANLEGEVIECPELEVPVVISVDSAGLESSYAIDKEEKLAEKHGESKNLLSCNYGKHPDVTEASMIIMQSENYTEDSPPTQILPVSHVNEPQTANVPKAQILENKASKYMNTGFTVTYSKELLDRFEFIREAASSIKWGTFGTADFENMGDQLDGETVISDENLALKENEDTENSKNGSVAIAFQEGSSTNTRVNQVHEMVSTPVNKVYSVSENPIMGLQKEIDVENGISEDDKPEKKLTKPKNKAAKLKEAAAPGLATVSGKDVPEKMQVEPTKSKEEIELERKAEEDEAKLKEQHRLDELTKAEEREWKEKRKEEKKKRKAEMKALKEAELKAQKEAEQKEKEEKEKEKRLRKKEKKKKKNSSTVVTAESSNSNNDSGGPISVSAIETLKENETKEVSTSIKPQRNVFTKQSTPQIRGKRNWNPWVIITGIIPASSIIFLYDTFLK